MNGVKVILFAAIWIGIAALIVEVYDPPIWWAILVGFCSGFGSTYIALKIWPLEIP